MPAPVASQSELQRRNERAARFQTSAADIALAEHRAKLQATAAKADGMQPGALRGQSCQLEKSYTRLTSLPSAADVRPLPVLRDAFELVISRWRARTCDYTYACDMLKSIRQDLTVQHLAADGTRTDFAQHVYEAHARIALQQGDIGELGACLAALAPIHAAQPAAPSVAEFGSYRLLHAALVRLESLGAELDTILGSLGAKAEDPAVVQALRIARWLSADEPVRVLRELASFHHLGAHLIASRVPQLRERALFVLCKAYFPALPCGFLASNLGYGDDVVGCESWLRSLGCVPAATSGKPEKELDTRAALRTLSSLHEERRRAADSLDGHDRHSFGAPSRSNALLAPHAWPA